MPLPFGQLVWRQSTFLELSPMQSFPLFSGSGLLHSLNLVFFPLPHSSEQFEYSPQLPQPPFTVPK
jgi:hypothetical protein